TVVGGNELERSIGCSTDNRSRSRCERDRQHRTAIVIGVLADQVHAARRRGGRRRRAAEGCAIQRYRLCAHRFDNGWGQWYSKPTGITTSFSTLLETRVCGGLRCCCWPEPLHCCTVRGSPSTSTIPARWGGRAP